MNYENRYRHCGQRWSSTWDCMCNDRCPVCNREIEPYESTEIDEDENEGNKYEQESLGIAAPDHDDGPER
jgi:hypothetical protein